MLVKRTFVNMCHIKTTQNNVTIACYYNNMGVEPKIGGNPPKMDGENHGSKPNPMFLMDDLGGYSTKPPLFLVQQATHMITPMIRLWRLFSALQLHQRWILFQPQHRRAKARTSTCQRFTFPCPSHLDYL